MTLNQRPSTSSAKSWQVFLILMNPLADIIHDITVQFSHNPPPKNTEFLGHLLYYIQNWVSQKTLILSFHLLQSGSNVYIIHVCNHVPAMYVKFLTHDYQPSPRPPLLHHLCHHITASSAIVRRSQGSLHPIPLFPSPNSMGANHWPCSPLKCLSLLSLLTKAFFQGQFSWSPV